MSYYNSDLDAFTLFHQNSDAHHDLHTLHHGPSIPSSSVEEIQRNGGVIHRHTTTDTITHHDHHRRNHSEDHHHNNSLVHLPHQLNNVSKNVARILPSAETLEQTALPFVGQALSGALGTAIANLAVYPLEVVVKRLQVQRAVVGFEREKRQGKAVKKRRVREKQLEEEEGLLAFELDTSDEGEQDDLSEGDGLVYGSDESVTESKWEALKGSQSYGGSLFSRPIQGSQKFNSLGRATRRKARVGVAPGTPEVHEETYTTVTPDGRIITTTTRTVTERIAEEPATEDGSSRHKVTSKGIGKGYEVGPDEWDYYDDVEGDIRSRDGNEDEYGYFTEGDEVEEIENYTGVIDAVGKIYEREGIKGFYSGVVEDTLQNIGNGFCYFATYTVLRHRRLAQHPPGTKSLTMIDELSLGIMASAISKFLTTPISNVVTRKQTAIFHQREEQQRNKGENGDTDGYAYIPVPNSNEKHKHLHQSKHQRQPPRPKSIDIIKEIYTERGITGLWAGYSPSLFMTLNPSLTFIIYELMSEVIPQRSREKRSHLETFLLGALAKAAASTVMYPFAVVKTRTQVRARKRMEDLEKEIKCLSESLSGKGSKGFKEEYQMRYGNAKSNIKDVTLEIYEQEGLKGFYVGLWAELLRGFFSNGITMLIKESVFHSLTSLYLSFLRLKNGHPGSSSSTITTTLHSLTREIQDTVGPTQQKLLNKSREMIEAGKSKWESGKGWLSSGAGIGSAAAIVEHKAEDVLGDVRARKDAFVGDGREFVRDRKTWATEGLVDTRRRAEDAIHIGKERAQETLINRNFHQHHNNNHNLDHRKEPPTTTKFTTTKNTSTTTKAHQPPATPIVLPAHNETPYARNVALATHQNSSKARVTKWLSQQANIDKYESPNTAAAPVSGANETATHKTNSGGATGGGGFLSKIKGVTSTTAMKNNAIDTPTPQRRGLINFGLGGVKKATSTSAPPRQQQLPSNPRPPRPPKASPPDYRDKVDFGETTGRGGGGGGGDDLDNDAVIEFNGRSRGGGNGAGRGYLLSERQVGRMEYDDDADGELVGRGYR